MASTYTVQVVPDASGWVGKLKAQLDPATRQIADDIKRQLQNAVREGLSGSGIDARVQGRRIGADVGDAFEREIKGKLRRAMANLPEGKTRLLIDAGPAERELAKIGAEISRLTDANLGVDLKDKDAIARLDELKLRLYRLTAPSHDIRLRTNAGAALAELAAIKVATDNVAKSQGLFSKIGGLSDGAGGPIALAAKLTAVTLVLSTVGPLAAAGAAGVIGLAGAAGVAALAFKGLKDQVDGGLGVGRYIKTDIGGIRSEIDALSRDAADVVSRPIHDLLQGVKRALPGFEPIVKIVGSQLGNAVADIGAALIDGARKAQPLFADIGGYIQLGAQKLRDWVASPSFTKFLDYARQELPIIIDYAKDFGKAIIDTFVALAPTGEGVLKILDFVAKALDAVANSGALTGGASLIGKLFGSGDDKKKANDATSTIDTYIQSVKDLTSTADVTSGSSGVLDQYSKIIGDVVPQLQAAAVNGHAFADSVNGIDSRLRSAAPALQTFMDTANSYDPATAKLGDTAKLLGDALTASRGYALDYAAAIVGADSATASLAKSVHDNLGSIAKDGTLLGVSLIDGAGKYVAANAKYTEGSQAIVSALQQQVSLATQAAVAQYTQVAATGDTVKAGNDALAMYKGLRQSFIDQSVAAGGTAQQVTALADKYFAIPPDVATFVKLLGQNDVSLAIQGLTDALNRLSDFVGAPKVGLNKTDFDNSSAIVKSGLDYFGHLIVKPMVGLNDGASGQVSRIRGELADLHDKTITITTIYNQRAGAKLADIAGARSAYGNIFSSVGHYAMGGIVDKLKASLPRFAGGSENHVPQIAMPNGAFRVWAEPETKGEAYIPFAMDRRGRAEDILGQVAQRFGGAYVPNTAALTAAASAPSGGSSGGSGLLGVAVTIDAGSVGTLTGHITGVADSRIARRESDIKLQKTDGNGHWYTSVLT